jgi:hypothetical protein
VDEVAGVSAAPAGAAPRLLLMVTVVGLGFFVYSRTLFRKSVAVTK